METFIIIALAGLSLIGWALAGLHARQRDEAIEAQQVEVCSYDKCEPVDSRFDEESFNTHIERRLEALDDELGTLYRHLGLYYKRVPTHGEVVTISSLGVLAGSLGTKTNNAKSTKERSA